MNAPARRVVALPETGMFPRAGKIRLGLTEPATSRAGKLFDRPKATDYFVVKADESGITSPDAAAAFHAIYGDEPREINVLIPGHTPEDVFEGAHRLYGTGKLKRRCDGETCDVRRATGGWDERPCVCKTDCIPPLILSSQGHAQRNEKHCTLAFTLQVLLAEVAGIGVWTMTTPSVIARDDIANQLQLAYLMTRDLAMMKAKLWMRPVEVSPDGKTKTVHVPSLRFDSYTPAQLMAGEGREQITTGPRVDLPALPAASDELDDDGDHVDSDEPEINVDIPPASPPADETLEDAIRRQLTTGLSELHAERVRNDYGKTVKTAIARLVELHSEDARDLPRLLDTLIENDAEHVNDDDVEIVGAET